MRVVGPSALGVVNLDPAFRLNASLAPQLPPAGRVGFFCQSGALGIQILATAAQRRLGLSTFVSAGNRADLSGNDLMQYWDTDPDTDVVLLYLESFGNPRKFARVARRLARRKPVVAVASGRHATRASRRRPRRSRTPRSRRCSTSPASSGSTRSTSSSTWRCSSPTSRCRAGRGSASSATPARWGCSPRTSRSPTGCTWRSRPSTWGRWPSPPSSPTPRCAPCRTTTATHSSSCSPRRSPPTAPRTPTRSPRP